MSNKEIEVTLPNRYTVELYEHEGDIFLGLINPKRYCISDTKLQYSEIKQIRNITALKFFEFIEPYYALIKAKDCEEAVKKYIEVVAGEEDEFDKLLEECKLVHELYAIVKLSQAVGEDGKLSDVEEIVEILESDEPEVLLIDGCLL